MLTNSSNSCVHWQEDVVCQGYVTRSGPSPSLNCSLMAVLSWKVLVLRLPNVPSSLTIPKTLESKVWPFHSSHRQAHRLGWVVGGIFFGKNDCKPRQLWCIFPWDWSQSRLWILFEIWDNLVSATSQPIDSIQSYSIRDGTGMWLVDRIWIDTIFQIHVFCLHLCCLNHSNLWQAWDPRDHNARGSWKNEEKLLFQFRKGKGFGEFGQEHLQEHDTVNEFDLVHRHAEDFAFWNVSGWPALC